MLAESVADKLQGGGALYLKNADPQFPARRDAAKAYFDRLGVPFVHFARQHGYSRRTVYKVLAGDLACQYGVSHNIAVRLGLKDGEVNPEWEPAQPVDARHD